ncbi:glycoside hydrolase family 31 protein [Neolentinus lepideus HHB14362 ss-1]|uniref:Glycoside hydrolase family 31 protein n=1 Tax=Neolentinus lepideus HHB14362 ss-1 TaxID=1314782 RepID=A0A165RVT4_9AGAM|nr:glycoside hydrolase family 31 protein [Neolentinus lepideus HHB14362 ss-1]
MFVAAVSVQFGLLLLTSSVVARTPSLQKKLFPKSFAAEKSNFSLNVSKYIVLRPNSSAGADVLLATPPSANVSLIEYRLLGGILDFYFFSGPTPESVIEQYGAVVGLPMWQPMWGFGFQLCRQQVEAMREAGIPLEVVWNDIDPYHAFRDFTSDPVTFPGEDMRTFIQELIFQSLMRLSRIKSMLQISSGPMSHAEVDLIDIVNPYIQGVQHYKATLFGPSGNMTVNGTSTYNCQPENSSSSTLTKRGLGAASESGVDLNNPEYAIHNGAGRLSVNTIATNATHAPGYIELDVHNMWGIMEEKTTHLAMQDINLGKRPFLIKSGPATSKWQYMYFSIRGVLQFQLYQIPMVGADTCGFREYLGYGTDRVEPYRWESVANASRTAIAVRYSMLPYWYTLFANTSTYGSPSVRALFYEFPNEPELFAVDRQFMIGCDILIAPVLTPNASTSMVTWRDWYTHAAVTTTPGVNTTLLAPLGHINMEVFFGTAYIDDGVSYPPGPNATVTFSVCSGKLEIKREGTYEVGSKVTSLTVLGVQKPNSVSILGKKVASEQWEYTAGVERNDLSQGSGNGASKYFYEAFILDKNGTIRAQAIRRRSSRTECAQAVFRSVTEITSNLAQNEHLLERLQVEQKETECKLQGIRSEIDRLRIERINLEGIRYRLVTELWHEIFDIVILEEDPLDGADSTSKGFYRAVTLSHVCRAWRDLLLSSHGSRYWTRILLRGNIACPGALAALQAYKERSGNVPLDLVFLPSLVRHQLQDIPLLRKQIDFALSNLIFGRAPWRSLTCESEDPGGMTHLMQSLSSFFPRLRSLRLSLDKPYSGPMHLSAEASTLFMSAPYELESLHLQHISPLVFPDELFSRVRFATLKCPGRDHRLRLSHITKFARNAPLLESFTIEGSPSYDIFVPNPVSQLFTSKHPDRPVLFQNLLDLKWGFLHPKEVHQILLFLDTPCLQILTLYLRNVLGGYSLAQNLFLDKPLVYKTLKELHLHYVEIGAIAWCLKCMTFPNLRRLSIENDDFDKAMLPVMTAFPTLFHVPAMPSLTHLSLFRVSLTAEWGEKTLSYLPSLRCLKIDACRGMEDLCKCFGATSMAMGKWVPVCPFLDELIFLDCADLQFTHLSTLIRKRNTFNTVLPAFDRGSEDVSFTFATPRKIKALRKGAAGSPNVATRKHSPVNSDEDVTPSKIIKVDVRGCLDVSPEQLESLWDLGVKLVCGDRRGRWVTEVTWKTC